MAITFETIPETKTKDGKNTATQRSLEIMLRFDISHGAMTAIKLTSILNRVVDESRKTVEAEKVDVRAVEGQWAWVYGPFFKGSIS